MKLVKKILIAHPDLRLRRRLVLLLADAGLDVRAHVSTEEALATARGEWFDLALVAQELEGGLGLDLAESLKKVQPTVPVILLCRKPDLTLVVKGIRIGLADVLVADHDLAPVLRRLGELLGLSHLAGEAGESVSPTEMSEVESVLARFEATGSPAAGGPLPAAEAEALRRELLRLTRTRTELEARVDRLLHEKTALEAELNTLLSQNTDVARQAGELNELKDERARVAAAQAAMDAKNQAIVDQREEIARERELLALERQTLLESLPALPAWAASAEAVEQMREQVLAGETRLRESTIQLQQESAQLARERRRWHDDLELLREQEKNLRDYENRLRKMQAQLEADRVLWFSSQSPAASAASVLDNDALREAWQKLQRATELLEAERSHLKEDRLRLLELQKDLARREQALEARESRVSATEERLRDLSGLAVPPAAEESGEVVTETRILSRTPLDVMRSVFGATRRMTSP